MNPMIKKLTVLSCSLMPCLSHALTIDTHTHVTLSPEEARTLYPLLGLPLDVENLSTEEQEDLMRELAASILQVITPEDIADAQNMVEEGSALLQRIAHAYNPALVEALANMHGRINYTFSSDVAEPVDPVSQLIQGE